MTERYDEQRLRKQLAVFNAAGLIAFSLSVAERLLPNYRRFVRETGWGDEAVLRRALDLGWSWLEHGVVERREAQRLQDACLKQAPDTDDFTTILVSSALDAANSAAIVAELVVESDVEKAVEIASYGRDTVDMYVQELENMPSNSTDLEERIRLHELMQRELINQREAIEAIASGIHPAEAVKRWRSLERGSIDND